MNYVNKLQQNTKEHFSCSVKNGKNDAHLLVLIVAGRQLTMSRYEINLILLAWRRSSYSKCESVSLFLRGGIFCPVSTI